MIINGLSSTALFYIYGLLGFVWLSIWDPMVPNQHPKTSLSDTEDDPPLLAMESLHKASPSCASEGGSVPLFEHAAAGPAGGALAGAGGAAMSGRGALPGSAPTVPSLFMTDLPWRAFVSNKCFWALLWAHTVFGIGYSTMIAWLPTYYNQSFGVDLKQSSWLSILPFLMMAIGTNASGHIADRLINGKISTPTKARKILQTIGSLGPGICLLYLSLAPQKVRRGFNLKFIDIFPMFPKAFVTRTGIRIYVIYGFKWT